MFSIKPKDHPESCTADAHHCCSTQPKGKMECPVCHKKAKGVLAKTLKHLLTDKAKATLSSLDGFYYCKTPFCEVVYFRDETVLTQKEMSVIVGLKEGAVPATVCYCFNWTKEKIREELQANGKTKALEDIKAKMEDPGCSCEILNPSGGCCLGDVGKAIKEIEKELLSP
ncbi:MAG: hypothetical protein P794_08135 [Epsilonproteobacteria bacterium (ex Lamellibrachia satsuma)]|nr:MAG: hypothetical protein P794_08135 [Epsilonproteobacteria bacterium (ex Lamellibrachia satsuma)]